MMKFYDRCRLQVILIFENDFFNKKIKNVVKNTYLIGMKSNILNKKRYFKLTKLNFFYNRIVSIQI